MPKTLTGPRVKKFIDEIKEVWKIGNLDEDEKNFLEDLWVEIEGNHMKKPDVDKFAITMEFIAAKTEEIYPGKMRKPEEKVNYVSLARYIFNKVYQEEAKTLSQDELKPWMLDDYIAELTKLADYTNAASWKKKMLGDFAGVLRAGTDNNQSLKREDIKEFASGIFKGGSYNKNHQRENIIETTEKLFDQVYEKHNPGKPR